MIKKTFMVDELDGWIGCSCVFFFLREHILCVYVIRMLRFMIEICWLFSRSVTDSCSIIYLCHALLFVYRPPC